MKPWYKKGLKFKCQGSGKCCISRGQWGYVYLTKEDRKRMADHFKMRLSSFTRKFCDKSGSTFYLKPQDSPECIFLEDNKCSIYKARPTQCRTWPFWPETMNAKAWKKDVLDFCPGAGKGPIHSAEEIDKVVQEQLQSEKEIFPD